MEGWDWKGIGVYKEKTLVRNWGESLSKQTNKIERIACT